MGDPAVEDQTRSDTCSDRRVKHIAVALPGPPFALGQRRGVRIVVDFYRGVGIEFAKLVSQREVVPRRKIWRIDDHSRCGIERAWRADADGQGALRCGSF